MKTKKTLYISLLIVAFFIVVLFFSIPSIISSTTFGKNAFLELLSKKTSAKIEIDSLHFSWFGPQIIDELSYADENVELKVESIRSNMNIVAFYKSLKSDEKIPFFAKTEIKNANIKIHSPNLPKAEFTNVNASMKISNNNMKTLEIHGNTLENSQTGSFSLKMDISKDKTLSMINAKQIPVVGIDHLLFYNNPKYFGLLTQILGPKMDIRITAKLSDQKGPIDIELSSTNAKTTLQTNLDKNEITLLKPATITLNLKQELNTNSLKHINPVFESGIRATKPIIIQISNTGFVLPIRPFNLNKLSIQRAVLDMGKIYVANRGALATINDIAKGPNTDMISLWFTYVNLKIEDGVLYSDRMDTLIGDHVHVCTWGTINLINKKVRMTLGIAADTLRYSFGLKSLPDDYVITIPVKGTTNKIKIDASKATAKILALAALQSQGKGIGAILGGIITNLESNDDVPPAKPLPWGGSIQGQQQSSPAFPDVFDFFD